MGPLFSFLAMVAMVLVLGACAPATSANDDSHVATVTEIVDGDTLYVAGLDERVRLIGIDTPETHGEGECYGEEATLYLRQLIPSGTEVEVSFDVEQFDRYDRYLAYLYRVSDGLFVNPAMLRDGYAQLLTIPPNVAHVDEFRLAQDQAREEQLGLWAVCDN